MKTILPQPVIDELNASGYPWRTENGKKHVKVYMAGHLALVVSYGGQKDRGCLIPNSIRSIRRKVAELRQDQGSKPE